MKVFSKSAGLSQTAPASVTIYPVPMTPESRSEPLAAAYSNSAAVLWHRRGRIDRQGPASGAPGGSNSNSAPQGSPARVSRAAGAACFLENQCASEHLPRQTAFFVDAIIDDANLARRTASNGRLRPNGLLAVAVR